MWRTFYSHIWYVLSAGKGCSFGQTTSSSVGTSQRGACLWAVSSQHSLRLRKHAWTSEELGKKKISRGNRTKKDQRETKTAFHVGTTWGKQRKKLVSRGWERNVKVIWYMRKSFQEEKEPGWRKKMKSKMMQALQNKNQEKDRVQTNTRSYKRKNSLTE